MTKQLMAAGLVLGMACAAVAQPTTDGTLVGDEAFYGSALSVQNTRTQFGDANNPDALLSGGGSEIDQVFMARSGDRLHVLITGNLEDNFNKLQIFLDTDSGTGVNTLDGANLPLAMDPFCCGGLEPPQGGNTTGEGALQRLSGLGFDTGFTADYALIVTQGREKVNPGLTDEVEFFGISAHYADLTQGAAGAVGGLGMQLAPRGLPQVLRGSSQPTGDYNANGTVDAADYTLWRDNEGAAAGTLPNDAVGTDPIGADQYDQWEAAFGNEGVQDGLGDFAFAPIGNPGNTESLLGPALPGLGQGELIDKNYALDPAGGDCDDSTGAGCIAAELEFALDVDPAELGSNDSSHRDFDNFVDLRLAVDNSNTAGVTGSGDNFEILPEDADDPENVVTGVEFSIPLDQIGSPGAGDDIRLVAFINGTGHDFLSNQFAGEGVLRSNLGGSDFIGFFPTMTLNDIAGDQFVTLPGVASANSVPEPTAALLALMATAGLAARRRF